MAEDLYLQRHEITNLITTLRSLVWKAIDLDTVIARDTRYVDNTMPGRSADDPLLFNEHASDIGWELRDLLRSWCYHTATQRHLTPPGTQRASGYAQWLADHAIDLALTDQAPQAADEIRDINKRVLRCIDRPVHKEFAGHCQSDVDGVSCGGVYVHPGADMHRCRLCDVQCDVGKMRDQIRTEMSGKLVSKKEVATALTIMTGKPVPYERVRNWIRRGQLKPVNGQDKYNLDHAHMLALQSRRKKRA